MQVLGYHITFRRILALKHVCHAPPLPEQALFEVLDLSRALAFLRSLFFVPSFIVHHKKKSTHTPKPVLLAESLADPCKRAPRVPTLLRAFPPPPSKRTNRARRGVYPSVFFCQGGSGHKNNRERVGKSGKNSSSLSQQTTFPSRRKSRIIEKSRVGKGGQADHTAATTSAKRRDGAKKKRSAKIVRRPGGVGGGSPGGGRRRFGAEIPCGQPSRHEHL